MRAPAIVAALATTFLHVVADAASLPTAKPEEVGFSPARLERIVHALRSDVESGRLPGAVVVVARKGRVALQESVGFRDKPAGAPMTPDAIFRIASMTKPIVSVAAMMLYEEGRLFLTDPVSKHLPALRGLNPTDREMTVHDLLRHTSGLTYGNRGQSAVHKQYPRSSNASSREMTGAELIERLAKVSLLHRPGTTWEYGLSTDVLGLVVEAVAGARLGRVLEERVFRPLKMPDTGFIVPADKRGRIAQPLAKDPDTGAEMTMPDFTAPLKFECGGGCLVSTAGDYVRFLQMLLNRGSLDGARLLGRKTVEYMTADHLGASMARGTPYLPGEGYGFGLGFAVRRETGVSGHTGSVGDYSWSGGFGTYFWVDPKEEMAVVWMAQTGAPQLRYYQTLIRTLVLQALD
jgi:CubicO group peptidase (beta-lactamase class C family)